MDRTFSRYARIVGLAVCFALAAFVWYAALREDREGMLTVAFLDVGQGDAALIETPHGNQVLIDLGPGTAVVRALGSIMPFYDRSIDMIMVTHPDADHAGGMPEVLDRFDVGVIILSDVEGTTDLWREGLRAIEREGAVVITADKPIEIVLDEGVTFEMIFPDRSARGFDTNVASLVGKLTYGETSFLFMGDAPREIESYLVDRWGGALKSTVLKVGHHGSRTSTLARFVAAVRPDYSVISAGKENRYGHPHADVLEVLDNIESEIVRTDEEGTIFFQSDGRSVSRVHY